MYITEDLNGSENNDNINGSAGSIKSGVELKQMKNSSISNRVAKEIAKVIIPSRNNKHHTNKKGKYSIISTREDADEVV